MEIAILVSLKTMETAMNERLDLPEPIAAYFVDGEAVARCFTKDAVVKDEGRTYTGLAAIKQWKAKATAKYLYTSVPFALENKDDMAVVTSRLTGNFPGSPVDLRFCFRLERGKIAALEIIP
jgi:hypothetical protein